MLRHRPRSDKYPATAILVVAGLFNAPSVSLGQSIPAFPGADGAGVYTTGGRGGEVYHVTQLDSGYGQGNIPGTLQYGLNDANFLVGGVVQPRTIVFDVGGSIWFGRNATDTNGWDSQDRITVGSKVTIAGQTAPGGINIMAGTLKVNGNQTIIRNVTVAAGYGTRGIGADGMPDSFVYDAINIHADNVMIDHVSAYFATDEAISADEFANHATVQYSNISQGQNYPQLDGTYTGHAFGSLWQPNSGAVTTIHHNLYAHQKGRLPRVGSTIGTGAFNDFRNNVVYNWLGTAGTGASGQPSFNNFVANFFLAGAGGDNPVGGSSSALTTAAGGTSVFNGNDTANTRIYHTGNLKDTNKDGDANDGVALGNGDFGSSTFVGSPYVTGYFGVTDSASAAYDRVLDYVGANWWDRSPIDQRIINEVRTGTGQIMAWNDSGRGNIVPGTTQVEWDWLLGLRGAASGGIGGAGIYKRPTTGYDSDFDGMPNAWELAHGLNTHFPNNNGDFDADGYTNLEEYLNEIAAWPAPKPLIFTGATNSRYEQITNWDIIWQPSRFDEAQINAGAVTVNSVGQHARVLKVAATAGSSATLTLNGGWLDVAEQVQVANNGQVIINAGALRTPNIQLSNAAMLKLMPGMNKTLKTGTISIADMAKLDVSDNQLIVTGMSVGEWNGSAYTGVTKLVADGRNGGAWNGTGIITSQTAAHSPSILTTLAVATAAQAGFVGGTFGGLAVNPDDVLVMYTFAGDANLSGDIDADDYFQIDSHYGKSGAANLSYFYGDFNYDGVINGDDFLIIDANYSATHPAGAQPVPEPACLGAALLATCLARRRRPRQTCSKMMPS